MLTQSTSNVVLMLKCKKNIGNTCFLLYHIVYVWYERSLAICARLW